MRGFYLAVNPVHFRATKTCRSETMKGVGVFVAKPTKKAAANKKVKPASKRKTPRPAMRRTATKPAKPVAKATTKSKAAARSAPAVKTTTTLKPAPAKKLSATAPLTKLGSLKTNIGERTPAATKPT